VFPSEGALLSCTGGPAMDGNPPVVGPGGFLLGFGSRRKERGGAGSHRPAITFPKASGGNRFPVNSRRSPSKRAADVLAYFDRPGTSNGPTKRSTAAWSTCAAPASASATSPTTSPDPYSRQADSDPEYTRHCEEAPFLGSAKIRRKPATIDLDLNLPKMSAGADRRRLLDQVQRCANAAGGPILCHRS
jgi:hypothetical protein